MTSGEPNTATEATMAAEQLAALEHVLTSQGLIETAEVDQTIEEADSLSPANGALVVATAWTDAAFRSRLLDNATDAARELGIEGVEGKYMVAVENTDDTHNVIVCTQCSCTAWPLIGLPPDWYKSPPYRARVVREARTVLTELGLTVPESKQIRVWDTSGDARYVVIPQRPSGTEDYTLDQLAALVTRDGLIGVALC